MAIKEYITKEEVLRRGQESIGIPLGKIDTTGRLSTGKGAIGNVLEESWFGYSVNSESQPDFPEAGVELKATPYFFTKKGERRAKERLVCNIINYMKEYNKTFKTSSFWQKCNTMLIMTYEHKANTSKCEFTIDKAILYSFPEEDLVIIEQDWNTIIEKIRAGKAHEISEGDTLYLGACTKGASAKSVREQPFSTIQAKQRAYSLKQSYMTSVLNNYIYGNKVDEKIIKNPQELVMTGFEQYIINKIKPFYGMTQEQLKERFGITTKPKHLNEMLLARMFNITGRISATEEFQKAGIVPKTIRIKHNGGIKESMSFPTMVFKDIIQETWEDSAFNRYISQTKFMFIIFREDLYGQYHFSDLMFWNIPEADLNEVRKVWQRTVNTLRRGVQLMYDGKSVSNNLPKKTENCIAHVRPHTSQSAYRFDDIEIGSLKNADELPDGRWMTKQCFWLNNTYIKQQIERYLRSK